MTVALKSLDTTRTYPVSATEAVSGASRPQDCGSHSGRWYCVETERGRETEVRDRLEDQGFGAFLPLVIALRPVKPGVMQAKAVPAFPGYLFTRFDARTSQWRSIFYTRGVKSLFCSTAHAPTPVPQRQMDVLLALGYDRPIVEDPRPALLKAGTRVRVMEGAFTSHEGVCVWDDRRRVALLIDIFGRSSQVEIRRSAVEAV
jgi:transcriptional antiterminator RfaH